MQQLSAAGGELQLQLTAAQEMMLQLTTDSAMLGQQLQEAETRILEMAVDVITVAEEHKLTQVLVQQSGAAEVDLKVQLAEVKEQVRQLQAASKKLESSLQEATAACEVAEDRKAEALNEVCVGLPRPCT